MWWQFSTALDVSRKRPTIALLVYQDCALLLPRSSGYSTIPFRMIEPLQRTNLLMKSNWTRFQLGIKCPQAKWRREREKLFFNHHSYLALKLVNTQFYTHGKYHSIPVFKKCYYLVKKMKGEKSLKNKSDVICNIFVLACH